MIQYTRVGSHTSDDTMIVNVPDDIKLSISGLFACAKYSVTLAAVNANGTGPFSNPIVAISGEDSELKYTAKYLCIYHRKTYSKNTLVRDASILLAKLLE